MAKPKLIGLYSPAPQSGKSTVAHELGGYHGYTVRGFAWPLKDMLDELLYQFGYLGEMRDEMLFGALKETAVPELGGRTPREVMQSLGTEWGRGMVSDSLWVDAALSAAKRCDGNVVFDDMRFPNEMAAIRAAGGVCIRVTRPGVQRGTTHASEGALDGESFDAEIVNDGSVAQLAAKVRNALEAAARRLEQRQVEPYAPC